MPTAHFRVLAPAAPRAGSSPLVRAGAVAAAAALGVMVGLGLRGAGSDGWATTLARLAVVTLRLRDLPEFVTPDRDGGAAAVFGGVHVATVAATWGVIIGTVHRWLVERGTPPRYAAAALAGVVSALVGADTLLPTSCRLAAGTLGGAEWVLMVAAVAAAAWAGARSA